MENVSIAVHQGSSATSIDAPLGMGLSLMEILKSYDYPIEATCGGMALCATCHIEVMSDTQLMEASDDEWLILQSLPNFTDRSRLACQISIEPEIDGLVIRLVEESIV
jgi:ferredoxin, 2Fe-2S